MIRVFSHQVRNTKFVYSGPFETEQTVLAWIQSYLHFTKLTNCSKRSTMHIQQFI